MASVGRVIEVDVPVARAYQQWTRFEDFPHFMEGVEEVQPLDENHLHWRATFGGKEKEWDSEITERIPNHLIAWRSVNGAQNAGAVSFEPLRDDRTLINFEMDYEPEGFIENMGEWLGLTIRRIERDLEHFKEYVEHDVGDANIATSQNDPAYAVREVGSESDLREAEIPETGIPERGIHSAIPESESAPIPYASEYDNMRPRVEDEASEPEAAVTTPAYQATQAPTGDADVMATASHTGNDAADPAPQAQGEERRRGDRRRTVGTHPASSSSSMSFNTGDWQSAQGRSHLGEAMERMVTRFMQRPYLGGRWRALWNTRQWLPPVEATERDGQLVICVDVPGMKRDNLRIDIDNDLLTIRGERQEENGGLDIRSMRSERTFGRFCRTIRVPRYVDTNNAQAALRDGVLQVSLPIPNRPQGRRVEVQVS